MVEKQPAHAPHLSPVLEEKIFVAGFFMQGIVMPVGLAKGAQGAMETRHALRYGIIRREVDAAAEPPGVARFEIADVHVDGGNMRVTGMHDEAYAGGEKGGAGRNME